MLSDAFFASVRHSLFGGHLTQDQVDGLNAIDKAWGLYGNRDRRCYAYVLATALHESDHFKTMEEYASGSAYEGRKDLGNTVPGDGRRFKGRGFVQCTGRRNYSYWSNRLGVDLLAHPEKAAERDVAARIIVEGMILGSFTGKKLADYLLGGKSDFVGARRIINGTDRAELIAGYVGHFYEALEAHVPPVVAAPYEPPLPDAPPVEPKAASPSVHPVAAGAGGAAIGAAILAGLHWLGWV
jgi:putative chitinase